MPDGDKIFCYHCRVHHPAGEVQKIVTKTGTRWRCIKSILATRVAREAREAYGRQMTEANKAESRAKAMSILHPGLVHRG